MKASTEEFLYFLLWGAQVLSRPTYSNFTSSFDQWAFRSGLSRRLQILEHQKLLESQGLTHETSPDERIIKLTEQGRVAALGGVDPESRWNRSWDGRWRLVLFDVPEDSNKQRVKLRRTLKNLKFGYLQNSVWLSPDSLSDHAQILAGARVNTESLTLFEGRPAGGESDQDLVQGAWNFVIVQQRYNAWLKIADQVPRTLTGGSNAWAALRQWARRERETWAAAMECDPLLPAILLPAGYEGRKCWAQRVNLLSKLSTDLKRES